MPSLQVRYACSTRARAVKFTTRAESLRAGIIILKYINGVIDHRQRRVFRALWAERRLSRSELHARTGLTPNGVGTLAEAMLRDGLLRECAPAPGTRPNGAGRPRVPLEIDPTRRHVIGLALEPGQVDVCRLGLSGTLL